MKHTHTTFVSTSVSSSSHLKIISLHVDSTNDGLLDVFQFTLLRRHGVYLVWGCINCKLTRIKVLKCRGTCILVYYLATWTFTTILLVIQHQHNVLLSKLINFILLNLSWYIYIYKFIHFDSIVNRNCQYTVMCSGKEDSTKDIALLP